jgi:hypothetical protein
MIREGAKEGTFAPGRGLWPPCPTPGRDDTNFLQEMTPMAAEKLESWSFCLSRKPSRTGWDVETTRSGYGYENAKANVMMDYKGWFIVRSRKVR